MFQTLSLSLYVSIGFLDPGGVKRSIRVARSYLRQCADRLLISRNVFVDFSFVDGTLEGVDREQWGANADEVKTVIAGTPWSCIRIRSRLETKVSLTSVVCNVSIKVEFRGL